MPIKKGKNKGYSVYNNKSGTKTIKKYVDLPDGTRKQISATGKTEKIALRNLDKKYADIWRNGKTIKNYTVKSWCEYWLFDIKKGNIEGKTFDGYCKKIRANIYPLLGTKKLSKLKLEDIQKCINQIKNRPSKADPTKTIKGKTAKEIVNPFLQALEYAMNNNYMPYMNFSLLDKPKSKKGTRQIRNKEEQKIVCDYFLNKLPNVPFDLYYAPIAVMDARGLRPQEVAGLKWEDINFKENYFWVGRHTVVKNDVYDNDKKRIGAKIIVKDMSKTPAGTRKLVLGDFLTKIFLEKLQEYINKGISIKNTDFVFKNKKGNLYFEESLRKMYKSLAKKLGITELGCYSLRHEFATYLAQELKCDRITTKSIMGWETIIETYFHSDNEKEIEILKQFDDQFKNESENKFKSRDNIIDFPKNNIVENQKYKKSNYPN